MGNGRQESAFTLLAGALFALVALAALLFLMLVRAPTGGVVQAQVTPAQPVSCPTGAHTPVCYQSVVTNVGSGAGQITCQVIPAIGTSAVFANDQDIYTTPVDVPIAENQSFKLTAMAKPLAGKTTVSQPPTIECSGVS